MFNRKKYEPKTIDELVIPNPVTRERLQDYADGNRAGHMIMHGPKGTGKTSAAEIISKQHEGQNESATMEMEGFESYEGATMTDKDVMELPKEWHWRKQCGMKPPTVVINELDKMSPDMLEKLKATMDQHKGDGQIIATTNNLFKLPPALRDRFDKIEMPALTASDLAARVIEMTNAEGANVSAAEVKNVLGNSTGSWRDALLATEDIVLQKKQQQKP